MVMNNHSKEAEGQAWVMVMLVSPILLLFRRYYPVIRGTRPASFGQKNPMILQRRAQGWILGYDFKEFETLFKIIAGPIK
jgi:hypothetical protein